MKGNPYLSRVGREGFQEEVVLVPSFPIGRGCPDEYRLSAFHERSAGVQTTSGHRSSLQPSSVESSELHCCPADLSYLLVGKKKGAQFSFMVDVSSWCSSFL